MEKDGPFLPGEIKDWELPEDVRTEVAETLAEAVGDPLVFIPDRQAAAGMLGYKAPEFDDEGRRRAVEALLPLLTEGVETHSVVQSIDNPLSALITNVGQPDDVKAASANSLLRLSHWMDDDQRLLLMEEIEKLRASRIESFGLAVSGGLRSFKPWNAKEEQWLQARLLLLMNAPHDTVRENTAKCVGELAGEGTLGSNAELFDTLLFLASGQSVRDRTGAAYALSWIRRNKQWKRDETVHVLKGLKGDRSHMVRKAAQSNGE
jgi:hypothetical protein